jgi:hypothetical protein
MGIEWEHEFRQRMVDFVVTRPPNEQEVPVSIKVSIDSGCFHAEHSPEAYRIIETYLARLDRPYEFSFLPHESGPELLVYVALGTAGLSIAKSIIDLVTAIINARAQGICRGDAPAAPLRLKLRRSRVDGSVKEETVLEIDSRTGASREDVDSALSDAIGRFLSADDQPHS